MIIPPSAARDRYYITTSLPYVNAPPHIGHALEFVQTDAFARYHRIGGADTRFLSGTDDNSLKNVLAAEREGVSVRELVDRNAGTFVDLNHTLGISNDDFIRTSIDRRHLAGVRRFWEACDRAGDLYRRTYSGLYCVGCEQFYAEDELVDGRCPEHETVPELVEEENYFFRLSRYTAQLLELLDSGQLRIVPESRKNEARSFVARGLEDFSVSRSRARARGWGVPVPGDPGQVMYVWYDALTNYTTALGYGNDEELYRRYWLENPARVHVIGKGILRFHAVYWPAMLLSAGMLPPTTLFVHGYLTVDGQKISKSLGNIVDPMDLVDRYGVDAVRYWLLREVPATGDADYTDEKLERRYTADLANDLGNLLQRTVSMLHRYRAGTVPAGLLEAAGTEFERLRASVVERFHAALDRDYDPQAALVAIWDLVGWMNRYVEASAPWALARAEQTGDQAAAQRLDGVLYRLAESLRVTAQLLRPLLPTTAQQISEQLGVASEIAPWSEALRWGLLAPGTRVAAPQPLFPRLARALPA